MPGKAGKKEKVALFFIVPFIFVVDRLLKNQVLERLPDGHSVPVIKGVFHLTRVHNTGAAFGLMRGYAEFLVFVAVASILLLGVYVWRRFVRQQAISTLTAVALLLVVAGALGNLYDRLVYGYVIDFLDFRVWPVFNPADVSISCGLILLACILFSSKSAR